MVKDRLIKPITLEIDERVWNRFKKNTSRMITLNEGVVRLIESSLDKKNIKLEQIVKKIKGIEGKGCEPAPCYYFDLLVEIMEYGGLSDCDRERFLGYMFGKRIDDRKEIEKNGK